MRLRAFIALWLLIAPYWGWAQSANEANDAAGVGEAALIGARANDAQNMQSIYFVNVQIAANRSQIGRELERRKIVRQSELRAINDSVVRELSEEEDALTKQRSGMSFQEFMPLAEAFDEKTNAARAQMDVINEQAVSEAEAQERRLIRLILGEVQRLSIERGNVTILNAATTAITINPNDNLTNLLIAKLDAIYQNDPEGIERFVFEGGGGAFEPPEGFDIESLNAPPERDENAIELEQEEVNPNE